MTTRANSQFPRPDFHRQDKQPYGLRATVRKRFRGLEPLPDGRGSVCVVSVLEFHNISGSGWANVS